MAVVIAQFAIPQGHVLACTCEEITPDIAIKQASVVFAGTVLTVEYKPSQVFYEPPFDLGIVQGDPLKTVIKVNEVWAGDVETYAIIEMSDPAACGGWFETRVDYL